MAMNRNEAPQIRPIDEKIAQSLRGERGGGGGRRRVASGGRGGGHVPSLAADGTAAATSYDGGCEQRGDDARDGGGRPGDGHALRGAQLVPGLEGQGQLDRGGRVASGGGQLVGEDPLDLGSDPRRGPGRAAPGAPATRGRRAARPAGSGRSTRRGGR